MTATLRVGVDLGGTKIEAIVLDAAGAVRGRLRVASPRDDYDATVTAIVDVVRDVEAEAGGRGTIGVGTPGAISPATGVLRNANSTWLNGRPLHRDLATRIGRPVRLANDANCFALSEATDGAGRGARVMFGVILGTGVGGGVVVDGRVLVGPHAIAGEWGHNPLPGPDAEELPGPACYCGRRGCIETFCSGPALERAYHDQTGRAARASAIADRAEAGDAAAEAVLAQYEDRLARSLATVINLLDPDAIVFGGGLSRIARLYDRVPKRWGAHVFSDRVETPLRPAAHGDASGVRGAAWLWGGGEGRRDEGTEG